MVEYAGAFNDIWRFIVSDSTWSNFSVNAGELEIQSRSGHGLTTIGNHLYVFGGQTDSGKPTVCSDLSAAFASVLISGSYFSCFATLSGFQNDLWRYNVLVNLWSYLPEYESGNKPAARGYFGLVSVRKKIYVFGGNNFSGNMKHCMTYDLLFTCILTAVCVQAFSTTFGLQICHNQQQSGPYCH